MAPITAADGRESLDDLKAKVLARTPATRNLLFQIRVDEGGVGGEVWALESIGLEVLLIELRVLAQYATIVPFPYRVCLSELGSKKFHSFILFYVIISPYF